MTDPKKHRNENMPPRDENLGAKFHRALASLGWRLPQTGDEIAEAEEWAKSNPPDVPAHVADPVQALARPTLRSVPLRPVSLEAEEEVEENLARAAREGAEIPAEIEERMRKDRDDAERKIDKP